MRQRVLSVFVTYLFMAVSLRYGIARQIAARQGELAWDSPYVTVNLNAVANDALAVPFPADRVQVGNIPFDLVNKAGATHLFLKPIGWSGAMTPADEYSLGYWGKYDIPEANKDNPARALVKVPVADYSAAWLLARAERDPALSNIVTLRLGIVDGQARVVYHDFTATVPRDGETADPAKGVQEVPTPAGNLFLVHIPLGKAIAQDFPERRFLDLDITKELRLSVRAPDPAGFAFRPLGPSSGVRIFGLTLERMPVQLKVEGLQPGNIFNEPQAPIFRISLLNVGNQHWIPYTIQAVAISDHGRTTTAVDPTEYRESSWVYRIPEEKRLIAIPVKERGHYELTINLLDAARNVVASRLTTFAYLAPDSQRKYRNESPFGSGSFDGVHGAPGDMDLLGTLYAKAGLRYVSGSTGWSAVRKRMYETYGLVEGSDTQWRYYEPTRKENPNLPVPSRFLIFHEWCISNNQVFKTPDTFTGKPPYVFDAEEEKTFQSFWKTAEDNYAAIKQNCPGSEILLGNSLPHLLEALVQRKFPRKLIDTAGNESPCLILPPETQPFDTLSINSCLWMMRQILDKHGYTDVPLRECIEVCYPGTNPGDLSEETQAAYYVRHAMHSLAWKIPIIRLGLIADSGNGYYFCHWGASGLCRTWPDVTPKKSYVAVATMTRMLDGAKFMRSVPVASTAVYALEFQRRDRQVVTCFWTPRGKRALMLKVAGKPMFSDMMGRESAVEVKDGRAEITITADPCYLVSTKPLAGITLGTTAREVTPEKDAFRIASFGSLDEWTVETERNYELESYNFMTLRRKGNYDFQPRATVDGVSNVLEVKPKLPYEGSAYLQMYAVLAHRTGVAIPGQPTEIGALVCGNGGWGRLIFELEDASGQRWTSIGAEDKSFGPMNPWLKTWLPADTLAKMDQSSPNINGYNANDAWGRSYINFDGWRYLRFPLPGQYPGEGYHWPRNSQWRFSGDGVVHYPLTFKKLIISEPEKVLYLNQYIRPPKYEIYLQDLMATYDPIEQVCASE